MSSSTAAGSRLGRQQHLARPAGAGQEQLPHRLTALDLLTAEPSRPGRRDGGPGPGGAAPGRSPPGGSPTADHRRVGRCAGPTRVVGPPDGPRDAAAPAAAPSTGALRAAVPPSAGDGTCRATSVPDERAVDRLAGVTAGSPRRPPSRPRPRRGRARRGPRAAVPSPSPVLRPPPTTGPASPRGAGPASARR